MHSRSPRGVWYNKTKMTSLWGCQHDSLPLVVNNHIGNPTGMSYLYGNISKAGIYVASVQAINN